jgi:transposase
MKKQPKRIKNAQETPINTVLSAAELQVANVSDLKEIIHLKDSVIDAQQQRIKILEEYLRLERARAYARSSEQSSAQGQLFDEVEQTSNETGDQEEKPRPKKKWHGGRTGLSKNIPQEQVRLNLTDEEKEGAVNTFYTVVKEELDIIPAKVRVLEYLQEKAVFIEGEKRTIKSAALPKHPIPKSIASVGLLAYVIVGKYCDGLPLHRLEKILARYGGKITRTTLANWMIRLSLQLQPLMNLMREHQLTYDYLQADETRIQVLKEPGRSAFTDKYMWVTRGGPPNRPSILFEYDPSRSQEVPLRLLDGFSGYLQTDGYAGYDAACARYHLVRLGCMDHARRYYMDALKALPKNTSGTKLSKSAIAVKKIGKFYEIEREIKELTPEQRYQERQRRSVPLLNEFKEWVDSNVAKIEKDSLTRKAMTYTINQWPRLIAFCEDGRLHMSNILAENAIRPFVIGRRGWLFADTPKGARASAMYYSLIESAKANGLEPHDYLYRMLKRLPYAETVENFEALLPWNISETVDSTGVNNAS